MTSTDTKKGAGKPAAGSAGRPGPALTSPEEIGLETGAGGPMPDRIEPGDDARLTASPATQDHDRRPGGSAEGEPPG
jgi:hypothetical protein